MLAHEDAIYWNKINQGKNIALIM